MKKIWKIARYGVLAIVFSVALSGCGKATTSSTSSTITVWSFEDPDIWKPITQAFQSQNKGYKLAYVQQTLDSGYENRVLNSVLSGEGPDVWAMPNDWVYRHKDKLYPMPAALSKMTNLDSQFVPVVKQSVQFDNNIYALTPNADPITVYYNQKIFDQALQDYNAAHSSQADAAARTTVSKMLNNAVPGTWTDFVETAKFLTKKDGSAITQAGAAIGTSNITNSADLLYLLMLQNGTRIVSDTLDLAMFNLPSETDQNVYAGKNALDFYVSFANPSSANYMWNDSLGNDVDAFVNGKVAMIFGYDGLQNYLSQKYPTFQYKRASMPQLSADPTTFVDYAKFNAFGVNTLSNNPTVAWNLVSEVAVDQASTINSAMKYYTAKKSVEAAATLADRVTNNPEKNELITAKTLIKGRNPIRFDSVMKNAIDQINDGRLTTKASLDVAANSITELLRSTSW